MKKKEEKSQNEKEWKERNPMIKKWLSLEEAEVAKKWEETNGIKMLNRKRKSENGTEGEKKLKNRTKDINEEEKQVGREETEKKKNN